MRFGRGVVGPGRRVQQLVEAIARLRILPPELRRVTLCGRVRPDGRLGDDSGSTLAHLLPEPVPLTRPQRVRQAQDFDQPGEVAQGFARLRLTPTDGSKCLG